MRDLDPTDFRLLLALSRSPRATTVALAEQLGLSRNTVQARMASLDAAGAFLSFDRSISQEALGYPLTAFTTVYCRQQQLAAIVAELTAIPEIVHAHGLSGPSDILVQIACASTDELFRVSERILAVDGVERTEMALSINELIPYRISPLLQQGADGLPPGSVGAAG